MSFIYPQMSGELRYGIWGSCLLLSGDASPLVWRRLLRQWHHAVFLRVFPSPPLMCHSFIVLCISVGIGVSDLAVSLRTRVFILPRELSAKILVLFCIIPFSLFSSFSPSPPNTSLVLGVSCSLLCIPCVFWFVALILFFCLLIYSLIVS